MTDFGYTRLTPEHVRHLKEIVGPDRFVEGSKLLEHYNIDWTHKYKGASRLALLPTTVDQISQIMKYCNMHRIAVVPQGGNTGLVGGATPIDDEVILSTEKMQTIRGFNEVSSIVSLEAGVILETANQYLRERGHMMPVDFGAKGSCTVGGILATNAAGLRFIRYGGMQSAIVGIEAVTADGCIIDSMNTCLKDNTGFPLRNLIVGSEGTLCIITAANIRVPIAPKSVNLLHASLESVESLLCIFLEARNSLSEILSAFEFWDAQSQELLDTYLNIKEPTVKESKFYVLIETNGSCDETDSLRAVAFMKKIMDKNLVVDGTIAGNNQPVQQHRLWKIRESIAEAAAEKAKSLPGRIVHKYDISMPPAHIYSIVETLRVFLSTECPGSVVLGYGHFGDGNIHINVCLGNCKKSTISYKDDYLAESYEVKSNPSKSSLNSSSATDSKNSLEIVGGFPSNLQSEALVNFQIQSTIEICDEYSKISPEESGEYLCSLFARKRLDPIVYKMVRESRGSISAEHGIGQLKVGYLQATKGPVEMKLMKLIKHALDPELILNPRKLLLQD